VALNKLWETLELSFNSKDIKVKHKKPNLGKLFDQEEHLIHTNKGNIHIMCHLEMFENEVTPILTIQTTNKDIMQNFMTNRGPQAVQFLSHWLKGEYKRQLEDE